MSPYATSPPFYCLWQEDGRDRALVQVGGELDVASAPQLTDALREARSRARVVVLNLRALTFIDSTGIHAILDAAARVQERGGRLLVARGQAAVDQMFTLTGACSEVMIFDVDPSEPAAELFDLQQRAA